MPLLYLLVLCALLAALLALHRPSHNRAWKPDFARLARGEIEGTTLTLHNIRNTRYGAPGSNYEVRWDTRSYDLSKLKRLWFVVESFSRIEAIAHTLLSFEFEDGQFLAVSVEARLEQGESYGILKGFLRQFELCYLFGDERDFLLKRTRYQEHEVYLYPLVTPPDEIRSLLLQMVARANDILDRPQFYNSVTDNCTSSLLKHANRVRPGSFSVWQLDQVLPGRSDKTLYNKGWLATEVPLARLREHHAIRQKALTCPEANFSNCIREGV